MATYVGDPVTTDTALPTPPTSPLTVVPAGGPAPEPTPPPVVKTPPAPPKSTGIPPQPPTGAGPGGRPGGVSGGFGGTSGVTAPNGNLSAADASAQATITNLLGQYGLASLGQWAWNKYLNGEDPTQIMLELRKTPDYEARFPAMAELAKQGHAITEASYINYEQSIAGLLHANGLPKGMYDSPQDIAKMLVSNVSVNEAQARIQLAATAAFSAPKEVRDALLSQQGIDAGHLISFFLDPDRAAPIIQRDLAMAQVAGAGATQGVNVDALTAANLADQGISFGQAQQGFGQVAQTAGLGGGFGETVNQGTRTAAAFGNSDANQAEQRVIKGRLANFNKGGGLAEQQGGVAGLGVSSA